MNHSRSVTLISESRKRTLLPITSILDVASQLSSTSRKLTEIQHSIGQRSRIQESWSSSRLFCNEFCDSQKPSVVNFPEYDFLGKPDLDSLEDELTSMKERQDKVSLSHTLGRSIRSLTVDQTVLENSYSDLKFKSHDVHLDFDSRAEAHKLQKIVSSNLTHKLQDINYQRGLLLQSSQYKEIHSPIISSTTTDMIQHTRWSIGCWSPTPSLRSTIFTKMSSHHSVNLLNSSHFAFVGVTSEDIHSSTRVALNSLCKRVQGDSKIDMQLLMEGQSSSSSSVVFFLHLTNSSEPHLNGRYLLSSGQSCSSCEDLLTSSGILVFANLYGYSVWREVMSSSSSSGSSGSGFGLKEFDETMTRLDEFSKLARDNKRLLLKGSSSSSSSSSRISYESTSTQSIEVLSLIEQRELFLTSLNEMKIQQQDSHQVQINIQEQILSLTNSIRQAVMKLHRSTKPVGSIMRKDRRWLVICRSPSSPSTSMGHVNYLGDFQTKSLALAAYDDYYNNNKTLNSRQSAKPKIVRAIKPCGKHMSLQSFDVDPDRLCDVCRYDKDENDALYYEWNGINYIKKMDCDVAVDDNTQTSRVDPVNKKNSNIGHEGDIPVTSIYAYRGSEVSITRMMKGDAITNRDLTSCIDAPEFHGLSVGHGRYYQAAKFGLNIDNIAKQKNSLQEKLTEKLSKEISVSPSHANVKKILNLIQASEVIIGGKLATIVHTAHSYLRLVDKWNHHSVVVQKAWRGYMQRISFTKQMGQAMTIRTRKRSMETVVASLSEQLSTFVLTQAVTRVSLTIVQPICKMIKSYCVNDGSRLCLVSLSPKYNFCLSKYSSACNSCKLFTIVYSCKFHSKVAFRIPCCCCNSSKIVSKNNIWSLSAYDLVTGSNICQVDFHEVAVINHLLRSNHSNELCQALKNISLMIKMENVTSIISHVNCLVHHMYQSLTLPRRDFNSDLSLSNDFTLGLIDKVTEPVEIIHEINHLHHNLSRKSLMRPVNDDYSTSILSCIRQSEVLSNVSLCIVASQSLQYFTKIMNNTSERIEEEEDVHVERFLMEIEDCAAVICNISSRITEKRIKIDCLVDQVDLDCSRHFDNSHTSSSSSSDPLIDTSAISLAKILRTDSVVVEGARKRIVELKLFIQTSLYRIRRLKILVSNVKEFIQMLSSVRHNLLQVSDVISQRSNSAKIACNRIIHMFIDSFDITSSWMNQSHRLRLHQTIWTMKLFPSERAERVIMGCWTLWDKHVQVITTKSIGTSSCRDDVLRVRCVVSIFFDPCTKHIKIEIIPSEDVTVLSVKKKLLSSRSMDNFIRVSREDFLLNEDEWKLLTKDCCHHQLLFDNSLTLLDNRLNNRSTILSFCREASNQLRLSTFIHCISGKYQFSPINKLIELIDTRFDLGL